jgi:iron complex transport system ATP-binding protein
VTAALELSHVSVGYPDRIVLEDLSFAVDPGELFAVVGPNGVGKSTLIKAASGVIPLMEGKLTVGGMEIHELKPAQRARSVGVVPQATHVPPFFTAEQVVIMGRTPYLGWLERESRADQRAAGKAMRRTRTETLATRRMGELSGGEQQRVIVARALAQAPSVLLLDEPTAHLDLRHQEEVLSLIRALSQEEGMSVLIALHDLNLVSRFSDRVALLSDGGIRVQGDPRSVLTPQDLAHAYGVKIHVMDHPLHGKPLVLSG